MSLEINTEYFGIYTPNFLNSLFMSAERYQF